MLIRHTQHAPEGSCYARHVFDESLGHAHQIRVEGEIVAEATLIGAIPDERYRSVELIWRVEAILGEWFVKAHEGGLTLDEYLPPLAFGKAERWGFTTSISKRRLG